MLPFDPNRFITSLPSGVVHLTPQATDGLNFVLAQVAQDTTNWPTVPHLAYGLATFFWETARTFKPITELGQHSYFDKYNAGTPLGIRLGNTAVGDGYLFRGRGFVQITGRSNYTHIGSLLEMDLAGNPDLALDPKVAYQIASGGMRLGWFTGRNLAHFLPPSGALDYEGARQIINGHDHAPDIAAIARAMEVALNGALLSAPVAANSAIAS